MKLYVAGKWEERDRCRELMQTLKDHGHTITYDWTHTEEVSSAQALLDMYGVLKAEALVVLADKDLPYKGAYAELGMACITGKPIYLIGPFMDGCIFTQLPQVQRGIESLIG